MDAEDELKAGKDIDEVYWRLIYTLSPNIEIFFWKNKKYSSLSDFGYEMLEKLRNKDMSDKDFWDKVLLHKLLSQYLDFHKVSNATHVALASLEATNADRRNDTVKYYLIDFLLTNKPELQIDDKIIYTTDELSSYVSQLINESEEKFDVFCSKLLSPDNKLTDEFEAWLIALGKRKELEKWKQSLIVY